MHEWPTTSGRPGAAGQRPRGELERLGLDVFRLQLPGPPVVPFCQLLARVNLPLAGIHVIESHNFQGKKLKVAQLVASREL